MGTATSILGNARVELSDPGYVTWPAVDLIHYLNWGLIEISLFRPDLFAASGVHSCTAGARQTMPAAVVKFQDVRRNISGRQRAITRATREMMDALDANWMSARQATEIQHYMFDVREPKYFYVYPPATAGTQIEITYSATPVPIELADPTTGTIDDAVGDVDLPIQLHPALTHYVLYRAFGKDNEATAHIQRAMNHYQSFIQHLQADGGAVVEIGPNSPANPNKVSARTGA